MNTATPPQKPEKLEPPITPPPLEPEQPPIEVRDSHHARVASRHVDDSAGDEGIDDAQADDTLINRPGTHDFADEDDHEEDLGEE